MEDTSELRNKVPEPFHFPRTLPLPFSKSPFYQSRTRSLSRRRVSRGLTWRYTALQTGGVAGRVQTARPGARQEEFDRKLGRIDPRT